MSFPALYVTPYPECIKHLRFQVSAYAADRKKRIVYYIFTLLIRLFFPAIKGFCCEILADHILLLLYGTLKYNIQLAGNMDFLVCK